MKILLISSSPRKEVSHTFLMAKEVLRGIPEQDASTEIIHLIDSKLSFCKHCEACHKTIMRCSIKDDVQVIYKKMLEAEGIILASPNYINHITASMKALFERLSHFLHCKRLLGKYICGVVSSGSGENKSVLDYIEYYAHICGAQYSGSVSARVPLSREKLEEAYNLGSKFFTDIKEKRIFPEQMLRIEQAKSYFKEIIKARKTDWQQEYQYWVDKGWI